MRRLHACCAPLLRPPAGDEEAEDGPGVRFQFSPSQHIRQQHAAADANAGPSIPAPRRPPSPAPDEAQPQAQRQDTSGGGGGAAAAAGLDAVDAGDGDDGDEPPGTPTGVRLRAFGAAGAAAGAEGPAAAAAAAAAVAAAGGQGARPGGPGAPVGGKAKGGKEQVKTIQVPQEVCVRMWELIKQRRAEVAAAGPGAAAAQGHAVGGSGAGGAGAGRGGGSGGDAHVDIWGALPKSVFLEKLLRWELVAAFHASSPLATAGRSSGVCCGEDSAWTAGTAARLTDSIRHTPCPVISTAAFLSPLLDFTDSPYPVIRSTLLWPERRTMDTLMTLRPLTRTSAGCARRPARSWWCSART